MKWPKLKKDYAGLTVETLIIIKNDYCEIPTRTICKVISYYHGKLQLSSEPCKSCGIRVIISKVSYNDVKLIALRDKNMRDGQDPCPKCGGTNIKYTYTSCLCCRTHEGNGRTCWQYPTCKTCGHTGGPGAGNSEGTCWTPF